MLYDPGSEVCKQGPEERSVVNNVKPVGTVTSKHALIGKRYDPGSMLRTCKQVAAHLGWWFDILPGFDTEVG